MIYSDIDVPETQCSDPVDVDEDDDKCMVDVKLDPKVLAAFIKLTKKDKPKEEAAAPRPVPERPREHMLDAEAEAAKAEVRRQEASANVEKFLANYRAQINQ